MYFILPCFVGFIIRACVCGCVRVFFYGTENFSSSSSMLSCAVLYSILLNAFQVTSNIRCLNSYMDSYPTISSSRFGCTLFLSMLVLLHIRLSANNQKERKNNTRREENEERWLNFSLLIIDCIKIECFPVIKGKSRLQQNHHIEWVEWRKLRW